MNGSHKKPLIIFDEAGDTPQAVWDKLYPKHPSIWTRLRLWFMRPSESWDIAYPGSDKSIKITYKRLDGSTYFEKIEEIPSGKP